jgi:septum formation protein
MSELILASASPRRKELLSQWLTAFEIKPADVDESRIGDETPKAYVARVAELKAKALAEKHPKSYVLAADTTVALGQTIFGKPADHAEAVAVLKTLSGTQHQVMTAIVLIGPDICQTQVVVTDVTFSTLSDAQIAVYCDSDEPYDKAGAYGIQGSASKFVSEIKGSYTNVVGLPLAQTATLLREAGFVLNGDQ